MAGKFLIVSILDLLLGINFLSPAGLLYDALEDDKTVYLTATEAASPYFSPSGETNYFPIRDWTVASPSISARSIIVYDSASQKVLLEKEPAAKIPIASLTKLAAAVMIVENVNLADVILVSASAIEKSKKEGGGANLYAGEKIRAEDLLKLMLIKSSNDAAYAFEEHLAAKHEVNLVERMNTKAAELGMKNTFFTEPAGLDDKLSFSTAEDLVKLVEYSFRYEDLYEILNIQTADVASIDGQLRHHISNTNQLLGKLFNIIGGKTGFTELAGGSMILVTRPPNPESRLITIVLGSSDRFVDAERLTSWANGAYIWK